MAVALTGTGGLFTRLGLLVGAVNEANAYRGTTAGARVSNLLAQFQTNEIATVAGLSADLAAYRSSASGWLTAVQTYAQNALVSQVNRDTPLAAQTVAAAVAVLAAQMKASADSLSQPAVSVATSAGSANYGDGVLAASLLDTDGLTRYMAVPEIVAGAVTSDAGRGATRFAEPVQLTAVPAAASPLDYLWPQGSGAAGSIPFRDAASPAGNLVTDGVFANWSGGLPSSWTVQTGTTATILQGTSPLRGTYDLRLLGDGATLDSLYQVVALQPNTVYAVNYRLKRSAGLSAGVLRVRLADGTGATLTNDAAGACSASVTLSSGATTAYTSQTAWFATPKVLPAAVRLYVELTTAIDATDTVDIDLLSMAAPAPLYTGGPYVAAFAGGTQAALGDTFAVTTTNGGGTTHFLPALDRLLSLRTLGLKLPTSGSPTVSDTLIA